MRLHLIVGLATTLVGHNVGLGDVEEARILGAGEQIAGHAGRVIGGIDHARRVAAGVGAHCLNGLRGTAEIDLGRGGELVTGRGGVLESGHRLDHAVRRNVGLAEVCEDKRALLRVRRKVDGRAVGLGGIRRAAHLHKAHTEVDEGLGRFRVVGIQGGLTVRGAGVARVAELGVRLAERHVGLVGATVVLVGQSMAQRVDGAAQVTEGHLRLAEVRVHSALVAVRGIRQGSTIGLRGLLHTTDAHESVAAQMASLAGARTGTALREENDCTLPVLGVICLFCPVEGRDIQR